MNSRSGRLGQEEARTTRRNPEMERFTEIKPIIVEGLPDARTVWLKVDHQSFCINDYSEDTDHAEWTRDMLCIALARMVAQCTQAKRAAQAAPPPTPKGLERWKQILRDVQNEMVWGNYNEMCLEAIRRSVEEALVAAHALRAPLGGEE